MTAHDIDLALRRIGARQHGAVARRQALAAGATDTVLRTRVASGRWRRPLRGAYVDASAPPTWEQRVMVAVLGTSGSVASGSTAAALHGLDRLRGGRIELTVPTGSHHRSRVASVRQSDLIEPTRVLGIPVNSIACTLVELAPRVPSDVLDGALESALRRRLTVAGFGAA